MTHASVSSQGVDFRALLESEERYRSLFNSIDEGFCIIEMIFDENEKPLDYRFLQINPSFEKQTGLTDALGKRMLELAPQHEKHWFEIYGNIALTGLPVRFQNRAEELHRWYDVYAFRFGDPKNRQVAILFHDITERKRMELELQKVHSELERSNRELEQFAYVASHDLQEPLRMVASYCQLLERYYKPQLDVEAGEFIAFAVDGAKRMQGLINDLLVYSRVGAKGDGFTQVSCAKALGQAISNLKIALYDSGTVLTYDALPQVAGDFVQLVQLFQNLISNAVKFCKVKPPLVHVGAVKKENEWLFSVRDNGIGIDPQFCDRIFVMFQRLHTRQEYSGTGIGLAVCKKIAERHGGRIWAESKSGQGSVFYFTIPDKGGCP